MKTIRITHSLSNQLLAEGPLGWGFTHFEGNYYIQQKYIKTSTLKINYLPGFCIYKFVYVWVDLCSDNKVISKNLGWKYILPNPLLPFIWFRVALPGYHSELNIEIDEN